jgi:hypothetical protein
MNRHTERSSITQKLLQVVFSLWSNPKLNTEDNPREDLLLMPRNFSHGRGVIPYLAKLGE